MENKVGAILISVKPKCSEQIIRGEDTLWVKRALPKSKLPCKVYVYESKGKEFPFSVNVDTVARDAESRYLDCKRGMPEIRIRQSKYGEMPFIAYGRMQVVGEFILNRIDRFYIKKNYISINSALENPTSSLSEIGNDSDEKIYAWRVEDLKVYNEPKEISDFVKEVRCSTCADHNSFDAGAICPDCIEGRRLKSAPHGWCYVEDITKEDM